MDELEIRFFRNIQIIDIAAVATNTGQGSSAEVNLNNNPLSAQPNDLQIPAPHA